MLAIFLYSKCVAFHNFTVQYSVVYSLWNLTLKSKIETNTVQYNTVQYSTAHRNIMSVVLCTDTTSFNYIEPHWEYMRLPASTDSVHLKLKSVCGGVGYKKINICSKLTKQDKNWGWKMLGMVLDVIALQWGVALLDRLG